MSCLITMSQKELHRLEVIQKIRDERLSVVQAAELLDLSRSQVHRLLQAYDQDGPAGLISKKRSRPSNRRALRGRSTRASDADNLAPAMAYANPGPIRTDCGLSFISTIAHCARPRGGSDDPTIGKAPGTPHSVFIFFTGVS